MPPLTLANLLVACLPPLLVPRQPGIHISGEIVAKSSSCTLSQVCVAPFAPASRRGALLCFSSPNPPGLQKADLSPISSAPHLLATSTTHLLALKSSATSLIKWTQEDSLSLSPRTPPPGAPPIASKISSRLVHSTSTTTPLSPPLSHSPFHPPLIPGSRQCLPFSFTGETQTLLNFRPTWPRTPRTRSPRGR